MNPIVLIIFAALAVFAQRTTVEGDLTIVIETKTLFQTTDISDVSATVLTTSTVYPETTSVTVASTTSTVLLMQAARNPIAASSSIPESSKSAKISSVIAHSSSYQLSHTNFTISNHSSYARSSQVNVSSFFNHSSYYPNVTTVARSSAFYPNSTRIFNSSRISVTPTAVSSNHTRLNVSSVFHFNSSLRPSSTLTTSPSSWMSTLIASSSQAQNSTYSTHSNGGGRIISNYPLIAVGLLALLF